MCERRGRSGLICGATWTAGRNSTTGQPGLRICDSAFHAQDVSTERSFSWVSIWNSDDGRPPSYRSDPSIKRTFCSKCYTVLIPGVTCKTRIRGEPRVTEIDVCSQLIDRKYSIEEAATSDDDDMQPLFLAIISPGPSSSPSLGTRIERIRNIGDSPSKQATGWPCSTRPASETRPSRSLLAKSGSPGRAYGRIASLRPACR